jgi:hypothetical protein
MSNAADRRKPGNNLQLQFLQIPPPLSHKDGKLFSDKVETAVPVEA